jgi:hypothetical protein
VRVLGARLAVNPPARNESEGAPRRALRWDPVRVHHRPTMLLREKGLSVSIYVGTRKMVNYA